MSEPTPVPDMDELKEAEKELELAEQEIRELKAEIREERMENRKIRSELASTKERLILGDIDTKTHRNHADAVLQDAQRDVQENNLQIESLKDELKMCKAKMALLETKTAVAVDELECFKNKFDILEIEKEEACFERDATVEKLGELLDFINFLQSNSDIVSQLKTQLHTEKQAKKQVQKHVSSQKSKLSQMIEELSDDDVVFDEPVSFTTKKGKSTKELEAQVEKLASRREKARKPVLPVSSAASSSLNALTSAITEPASESSSDEAPKKRKRAAQAETKPAKSTKTSKPSKISKPSKTSKADKASKSGDELDEKHSDDFDSEGVLHEEAMELSTTAKKIAKASKTSKATPFTEQDNNAQTATKPATKPPAQPALSAPVGVTVEQKKNMKKLFNPAVSRQKENLMQKNLGGFNMAAKPAGLFKQFLSGKAISISVPKLKR
mmetsp:Transcript_7518/g.14232  ORF Transcript_7518/g.14232 Transcript_7518/m.14232 type:complete len:441 (+) Transcript_7518:47-1369(+)